MAAKARRLMAPPSSTFKTNKRKEGLTRPALLSDLSEDGEVWGTRGGG